MQLFRNHRTPHALRYRVLLPLLVLSLFSVSCGAEQAADPQVIAQAVQATLTALPPQLPQSVEVTRVVEITREVEVQVTREVIVTATPVPPPPTATPTNKLPIEVGEPIVLSSTDYSGDGRLDLLVMVKNPNPDWWLPMSRLNVSVFDADDNIIATESDVVGVGPGAEVPVLVTGIDLADKVHDRILIELMPDDLRPANRWPGAEVELVQSNIVGDSIVGQIKNNGAVEIPQTQVIGVIKDMNGSVIDLDFTYADQMGPGQVVPFDLSLGSLDIDEFDYELFLVPELVAGTF